MVPLDIHLQLIKQRSQGLDPCCVLRVAAFVVLQHLQRPEAFLSLGLTLNSWTALSHACDVKRMLLYRSQVWQHLEHDVSAAT